MDLKTGFSNPFFCLNLQHQTHQTNNQNYAKKITCNPWDNIPRVHHGVVPRLYGYAESMAVVDGRRAVPARRPGAQLRCNRHCPRPYFAVWTHILLGHLPGGNVPGRSVAHRGKIQEKPLLVLQRKQDSQVFGAWRLCDTAFGGSQQHCNTHRTVQRIRTNGRKPLWPYIHKVSTISSQKPPSITTPTLFMRWTYGSRRCRFSLWR